MAVQSADPIAMVNHHGAAVAVHKIREADNAVRRSNDASAVITGNVHAAMERSLAAERINALAKRSGKSSLDWPERRRLRQPHPIPRAGVAYITHANADRCRAGHCRIPQRIKLLQ